MDWEPPPKSECFEETVQVLPDTQNLITMRRVEWNGQLVEYAVVHSVLDESGNWVEKTCIDSKHGSVHRHDGGKPHTPEGARVLRPISTQIDVQQSFKPSFDEVYDSYIESVEGVGQ